MHDVEGAGRARKQAGIVGGGHQQVPCGGRDPLGGGKMERADGRRQRSGEDRATVTKRRSVRNGERPRNKSGLQELQKNRSKIKQNQTQNQETNKQN